MKSVILQTNILHTTCTLFAAIRSLVGLEADQLVEQSFDADSTLNAIEGGCGDTIEVGEL